VSCKKYKYRLTKKIGRAIIVLVPDLFKKDEANFAIGEYGVWKKRGQD